METFEQKMYANLAPLLQKERFSLHSKLKQFRRKTSFGFQNIVFSVHQQNEQYYIDVNLGVRFDMVEQISQQFLDICPSFRPESTTMMISVKKLVENKYLEYKINQQNEKQELEIFINQIHDFMLKKGYDFLQEISQIKNADEMLNAFPCQNTPYLYDQVQRCFKALIIARMCNRNLFIPLLETYYEHLQNLETPEKMICNYDRLANYLLHFSFN
ncbi:MAG: hypothetical protein EAZ97_15155 [Bacteroidetes bacterium]|nr:MAG: hypothetical protein EAZ97_15155 [Bacteroidota bacterium]